MMLEPFLSLICKMLRENRGTPCSAIAISCMSIQYGHVMHACYYVNDAYLADIVVHEDWVNWNINRKGWR